MINEQVQEIFVEDIIPNRFQPRLTFDEKALQELSDSIKVHGVIQPLVLRKVGNKYEIIAGERRYKASCMAGLKKVPAIVRDMSDDESAEVAVIENVQRKNLTSIEEALSYRNLLERGYLTQEELAVKLGVAQSTIANKMRLLNLCEEVQDALLTEKISERHARSLLVLEDFNDQKKMLDRIIKERLTVKQLDIEIKKMTNNGTSEETGDEMINEPITNIFGMPINNDNMETVAPNLNTGVEEKIEPINFNPFNSPVQSSLDTFSLESSNTQAEEPIEMFDMFGDIIAPGNDISNVEGEAPIVVTIGDQIKKIRETVIDIENSGFLTEKEEYDFEDMYQVIIKIKKD